MQRSSNKTRPFTVRLALTLFGATVLLGLAKLGVALSSMAGPGGHSFTIFTFVCIYSLFTTLIFYAAMGASWARGGIFVVFLIGIAPGLPLAFAYFSVIPLPALLTLAQVVCVVAGLFLAYREPAASWFKPPQDRNVLERF